MNILITGAAGFIGFSFSKHLLDRKYKVYGIDNYDAYYSVRLKKKRINILKKNKNFSFKKIDLKNKNNLMSFLKKNKFNFVFHFAAQAGVRFSISNPQKYFDDNISAFFNLLDCLKKYKSTKIFYASSSSVYGDSKSYPVKENFDTNPKNFYGLSKKINEQIANIYFKNFKMKLIGLRFFTVFGEWGRPDMLLIKFFDYHKKNKIFTINNSGNHYRDFTYIKDVNKILFMLTKKENFKFHKIYNLSSGKPKKIKKIINILSKITKYKKLKNGPLQKVEAIKTYGDSSLIKKITGINKFTKLEVGIKNTFNWYNKYQKLI